jgi:uncharacterized protein (TIGR00369 family)
MNSDLRAGPFFDQHLSIRVLERGAGRIVLTCDSTDEHLNLAGMVHGGLLASLLDMGVAGAAAAAVNDGDDTYGLTLSITVNFVRPLGAGLVRCEGTCVGGSKVTKFAEARIVIDGEEDQPVATATGTVKLVPLPEEGER